MSTLLSDPPTLPVSIDGMKAYFADTSGLKAPVPNFMYGRFKGAGYAGVQLLERVAHSILTLTTGFVTRDPNSRGGTRLVETRAYLRLFISDVFYAFALHG